MIESAIKRLSANDLGLTRSHQAGFLIPKSLVKGGLFDTLPRVDLDPRLALRFYDYSRAVEFVPTYIYYNNKYFGGTRCEYRLTGLVKFIREHGLREGDSIKIEKIERFMYEIQVVKVARAALHLTTESWTAIYGKVI